MRADEKIFASLRGRRPGHTLSREFYVEPDVYKLDLDLLFYRDWLFAGHDCEIEKPGDYLTLQVGDYPIVVVRGRDGEIRAFHNSCRHRGSRICSAEKGSAVRLVCPYHNWSYDLDGRLLFARDTAKPFDMKALGLKSIACESVAGYIWICIAADPPDFAPFRATMAPYFQPHNLTHAKVAFESTIVENGNWKLVWENNRECYHCLPNHPELCRSFPEDPSVTGVEGAGEDPEISAHWARLEARGLPSQFRMSPEGQFRVARMPLIKDVESYTMSGRRAVKQPLNVAFDTSRMGSLLMFHYPSMWNHVLGDHAITFRVLPLGPKLTAVTTKWLVNAEAVEGVDYDLPTLTEVWMATNDQDRRIVEENQIGVSSPAFEPGPYNGLHEGGVMQFVDWYAGALERAQGGPGLRAHVA